MKKRALARPALALVLALVALAFSAVEAPAAGTLVRADLRLDPPQIEGTVTMPARADGTDGANLVLFHLFGRRFAVPPRWNELSRYALLADGVWRPGDMEILSAEVDGRDRPILAVQAGGFAPGTLVAVDLGEIPEGRDVSLSLRFRTRLPNLRDVFGGGRGLWLAIDGWAPVPLSQWAVSRREPVRFRLSVQGDVTAIAAGKAWKEGTVEIESPTGALALVASADPPAKRSFRVGRRDVTLWTVLEPALEHRISHNAIAEDALVDSLAAVLEASTDPEALTIVRAPLRWIPTASTSELVVVSDRLFDIHPILRPLHQRELAYAVFLHEEMARLGASGDLPWVAEGLAWRRAQSLYEERLRSGRDVRDWIGLFDLFAIVDRFETAPRVPFARTFFPTRWSDDELALRPEGAAGTRPAGRMIFSRLEARLGHDVFERVLARHAAGEGPFRGLLRDEGGERIDGFLEPWLESWPRWNYAIESSRRNPAGRPGASFVLRREGGDARADAIEVGLDTAAGEERFFVDVVAERTEVRRETVAPVERIRVDPGRREVQTRLDDDESPPSLHFLLDSADVEVSSTEFGFSTLLVGRRRYDYRRDVAAAGFHTNRSTGVNLGVQLHGGTPIDDNLFRHNLFAYFSLQELDAGFRGEGDRLPRTSGGLKGFGLRYNYFEAFWFENPSEARHLRLFLDVFDGALGSDYDYLQTGGSLSGAIELRPDTIVAVQVVNGFDVSTGEGPVPNQGLFSLGGFRSIRGIGAEEELAENLFVVRAELRHLLPLRLDLNFEDALVARRLQLRAYVDAGRVDDHRGRIYDPGGFAVGAGGGFNLFYDFLGFFPSSFYLDLATRVDRSAGPQVLFGARQPF